ncbi:MAG: phosphotransferase [Thermodesulfovibrionales bacterium]|nr:phosphotransferase [Thermodesulfovibrionales bacterium]
MDEKITCFILAAGYGERLRPITDYIPKPLLPILGFPSLERVIQKVVNIGIKRIGINVYHKRELLTGWLKKRTPLNSEKIVLFYEDRLLGTGGGLKNAEHFLDKTHFLVYNSDIITDIDLSKLVDFHFDSKNIATLAIQDCPEHNKLIVNGEGFLEGISYQNFHSFSKLLAFIGIAIYSPDFLAFLPEGPSNVVEGWIEAISQGKKIGCFLYNNHYWSDIGTPSRYVSAIIHELKAEGETVYIHPKTQNTKNILFDGYLIVEGECFIEEGSTLKNCVILSNTYVQRGNYENCILGDRFKVQLDESAFVGIPEKDVPVRIGYGGSDRKYFRIKKEDKTYILLESERTDPNFLRQIELTKLFNHLNIPVPKLISVDYDSCNAVFEDLGDVSLYSWLKLPRRPEEIESIYKKAIDCLYLIHSKAATSIEKFPNIKLEKFDYNHLRWESEYFVKRFIIDIRGIELKDQSALFEELNTLAYAVDSFKKGLMHRDFQSQNIMVTYDQEVKVIDYQSSKIGPQAYDMASLLWDPYYRIDDKIREKLLEYYLEKRINEIDFSEKEFLQLLQLCRLQRHMQVLGAYGFLSKVKGKKYFLKYIPEGIRLLKDIAFTKRDEYPELYRLTLLI